MKYFWILMLASLAGCATVTRTMETTPVDLDGDGKMETTRTSESVSYTGAIPPRPETLFDASDPTKGQALDVAEHAIDEGMATSVSVSGEGDVSLSASPAYTYGTGSGVVYGPSGQMQAGPDVVSSPSGYGYVQVGGQGSSSLAQPVVVSVPRQAPVLVPGQKVECPDKGQPDPLPGTPEFDACTQMALEALFGAHAN